MSESKRKHFSGEFMPQGHSHAITATLSSIAE